MTPEQQEAIQALRAARHLMPADISQLSPRIRKYWGKLLESVDDVLFTFAYEGGAPPPPDDTEGGQQ